MLTNVANVLRALFAFFFEHGDLFRAGHIQVSVLNTVGVGDLCPGFDPVCPGVRHTDRGHFAFFLGLRFEILEGHAVVIDGGFFRCGSFVARSAAASEADSERCCQEHRGDRFDTFFHLVRCSPFKSVR